MQFKFFGGAQEVGRSSIMVEDGRRIMLDYGMKVEDKKHEFPIGLPDIDAMVLSHAHLDHSGDSPSIYNKLTVPIFGTEPTKKTTMLLLEDTLKIAKNQHAEINFHRKQYKDFMKHYQSMEYHEKEHFGKFDISLYDAGHISGSAITLIENPLSKDYKRIVYTGDYKMDSQLLHKGAEIVKSDVLITESTYANKDHPSRDELAKNFIEDVKAVLESKGTALVPVFAVGRSQEILALLHKNGLAESTYVDGMARAATKIALEFPDYIDNYDLLAEAVDKANFIGDMDMREEAMGQPSVILTTAGMLSGGPVLDYITRLNKDSKIFLTGYQVEGTNGRLLLNSGKIKMHNSFKSIKTPVSIYDFSAHCGKSDLYKYVRESAPNVVICVHGSEENTTGFASELKAEGFDAYAPKVGDTIKL